MANQLPLKYENYKDFVSMCKNFVKSIEKFSGSDRLINWYQYLFWIEENFIIDFKKETIFDQILAACLCQFEKEKRYKQDRRLVKLFIKYVSEFSFKKIKINKRCTFKHRTPCHFDVK